MIAVTQQLDFTDVVGIVGFARRSRKRLCTVGSLHGYGYLVITAEHPDGERKGSNSPGYSNLRLLARHVVVQLRAAPLRRHQKLLPQADVSGSVSGTSVHELTTVPPSSKHVDCCTSPHRSVSGSWHHTSPLSNPNRGRTLSRLLFVMAGTSVMPFFAVIDYRCAQHVQQPWTASAPACGSRRPGHYSSYGKYRYGSEIEILRCAAMAAGPPTQCCRRARCRRSGVSCRAAGRGRRRRVAAAQACALRWCRWYLLPASFADGRTRPEAAVAQLVEQGTENPCVNSSILFGGIVRRGSIALQLRFQAYGPVR